MGLFGNYVRRDSFTLTAQEFSDLVDYLSEEGKVKTIKGPYESARGASMSEEALRGFAEEMAEWGVDEVSLKTTLVNYDKKRIEKMDWHKALRRARTYMIAHDMSARKEGRWRNTDYSFREPRNDKERESALGNVVAERKTTLTPHVMELLLEKHDEEMARRIREEEGICDLKTFVEDTYPKIYRRCSGQIDLASKMNTAVLARYLERIFGGNWRYSAPRAGLQR